MTRKRADTRPPSPATPSAARLGSALTATVAEPQRRKLPRGSTSLPRDVVEEEQRKRLVVAIAKVISMKGYADTTVSDVIAAACVSRATFYGLFKDKEECFLFGFEKLSKAHARDIAGEISADAPLPEQMLAALRSYLRRIDSDLDLARAFIAEAESATARSRAAYADRLAMLHEAVLRWVQELRRRHPEVAMPSEVDMSLLMAGLSGHIIRQVRCARPFTEPDVLAIFRFLLAGLGLYEWARHAGTLGAGADGD